MSDFGAIIYIKKKDKSAFSDKEFASMKVKTDALGERLGLRNSMGKPYLYQLGQSINIKDGQCYTINLLLSDYYGDSSDFDWHKIDEKDLPEIEEAVAELLDEEYDMQGSYEWW